MMAPTKYNVLWVEDEATFDLTRLAAAVHVTFRYNLTIARTITEAMQKINNGVEYDAIIMDMRITPGEDDRWKQCEELLEGNREKVLLGQELIYSLLLPGQSRVKLAKTEIPSWITPNCFAVMTVEPEKEIEPVFATGIARKCYQQKRASMSHTALLDLIESITKNEN